jgi:hypothetical protein
MPARIRQHGLGRNRLDIRDQRLAGPPALGQGGDQVHIDRVDLLDARDPHRPEQSQG